jgi:anti-sigma factor (TIGR02949 family)
MVRDLRCEEAVGRLEDFLDRELSASEAAEVEGHLATCLDCARAFAFESSLLAGLRGKLRRLDLAPGVRARLLAALAALAPQPPPQLEGPAGTA